MDNMDFRQIILEQRKNNHDADWSGTCLDYLYLIKEDPKIAQIAATPLFTGVSERKKIT